MTVAGRLEAAAIPFDWVEADRRAGGALHRVHNPLYGWPAADGCTGASYAQTLDLGLSQTCLRRGVRLERLERIEDRFRAHWSVTESQPPQGPWARVVLATGTAPRRWEVPGSTGRWERGVELSTHRRGEVYAGLPVAVVGGGDAAAEGALRLAAMGCRVWLIARRAALTAQRDFADQVAAHPAIEVCLSTEVTAVECREDEDLLRAVRLSDGRRIAVAGLFVRVGVTPLLPGLLPMPTLDAHGYLAVDAAGESSVRGLFGAGEVSGREVSQLVSVEAQAARVAEHLIAILRRP